MGWTVPAKKGGDGEYAKAPPGNHLAVLVAIIDMGTQRHDFQGKISWLRRGFFVWELCGEQIQATNKNHVIGIDLTISLVENAKLRKFIESRLGKRLDNGSEYDFTSELGQPCLLNVVNNAAGYPMIQGVSPVPKGFPVQQSTYPVTLWRLEENYKAGQPIQGIPDWVPYFYGNPIVDHIKGCKEIAGAAAGPPERKASNKRVGPDTQQTTGEIVDEYTGDSSDIPF